MEQLLPHSLEAEAAILSALLTDQDGKAFDQCGAIKPDIFHIRSHRLVFETILYLHENSHPVDTITVTNRLTELKQIESIGGAYFISKLGTVFATSSHVEYYVEVLHDKFRRRALLDICAQTEMQSYGECSSKETLTDLEAEVFALSSNDGVTGENQLQDAASEVEKMIAIRRDGKTVWGLLSGIKPFDDIHCGFQPSQYYVLAGRPSAGKTAFADQTALNIIMEGHALLYICLESDKSRVLAKMACKLAKVSYTAFTNNLLKPNLLEEVSRCLQRIKKSNLILIRPMDVTGTEIRSLMRRAKRRSGIKLMILDYLQKVSIPKGWDERRAVSDASLQIQRGCVETGVPALVLCQLNRESEKEARPKMSHLKESGQIEQDADNIDLLWPEKDKRTLEIGEHLPVFCSVEKNKDGPSGRDVRLNFEMDKMTFHTPSKPHETINRNEPQRTPYND